MQTEFELYLGPDLWASGNWFLPMQPSSSWVGNLQSRNSSGGPGDVNDVQMEFGNDVQPLSGWLTVRARIVVGYGTWFADYKPLTWYVDEPTDWHSGLARWVFPAVARDDIRGFNPIPESRWTLTARRLA